MSDNFHARFITFINTILGENGDEDSVVGQKSTNDASQFIQLKAALG